MVIAHAALVITYIGSVCISFEYCRFAIVVAAVVAMHTHSFMRLVRLFSLHSCSCTCIFFPDR